MPPTMVVRTPTMLASRHPIPMIESWMPHLPMAVHQPLAVVPATVMPLQTECTTSGGLHSFMVNDELNPYMFIVSSKQHGLINPLASGGTSQTRRASRFFSLTAAQHTNQ